MEKDGGEKESGGDMPMTNAASVTGTKAGKHSNFKEHDKMLHKMMPDMGDCKE